MIKLDDYIIPFFELFVELSMPLKDEDASGETSGTARAKKGAKAKRLEVRGCIRCKDIDKLTELSRYAEKIENGDAKVYTITNDTANSAGMRQATFSGTLKIAENEDLHKWDISFSLIEYISVPERAESRENEKNTTTQESKGFEVGLNDAVDEKERKLSNTEKVLKSLNEKLSSIG